MRNNLILSNTSSASDMIGTAGEDQLNRAFRDAKKVYLDSWQGLAETLNEAAPASGSRFGGNSERSSAKDNLSNFYSQLDELEGITRQYPLSKQDPTLRDRLKVDVRAAVVPALQSYLSRHQKVEKCKSLCIFTVSVWSLIFAALW